jgi:hypothetical protein
MVVLESWEGTHNVLCLQVLRDIERYQLHQPFLRFIGQQIGEVTHESLSRSRVQVAASVTRAELLLARIAKQGAVYGQAHARRLADLLAMIAQAALMLNEAQWELDQGVPTIKPDVVAYFCRRHLVPTYDVTTDDEYIDRLQRIMNGA